MFICIDKMLFMFSYVPLSFILDRLLAISTALPLEATRPTSRSGTNYEAHDANLLRFCILNSNKKKFRERTLENGLRQIDELHWPIVLQSGRLINTAFRSCYNQLMRSQY